MISTDITKTHVSDAIRRVIRDGVPSRRRSRGYCLVTNGKHLPPKYTIARAHEVVSGKLLPPDEFSGGRESNEFLRSRGFAVVKCGCGGNIHGPRVPREPEPTTEPEPTAGRHSERCAECKTRVRQLLDRIYGNCLRNHRFRWPIGLADYAQTPIGSALGKVARVLEEHRGFRTDEFVRTSMLAPCDYWVPDPGFIVEFDESQHFTNPRRLALSVYADSDLLGFSAKRWMELCERHSARDNDPPYRDEQRAWYDTLRDLVPSIKGLEPTVRLYARDCAWCSLDPDSAEDRERFSDLMNREHPLSGPTPEEIPSVAVRPASTLHVGMMFPRWDPEQPNVPPDVPTAASFAGEAVDFVLFPEAYIWESDQESAEALKKLASDLGATLLVGATDDSRRRRREVLLRFDPDHSRSQMYVKHSQACAVAFERPDWQPSSELPTFELGGVTAGATICHDHYLGLLPRFLGKRGACLWVNPSFDNVVDIKWSSVLRMRAVENHFFALCSLHDNIRKRTRTHPFAFAPDGAELSARKAGSRVEWPLSECRDPGNIYIVNIDLAAVDKPLEWSTLPPAKKPKRPRNGKPLKPIRVALRDGQPAVVRCSNQYTVDSAFRVETVHGPVYVGTLPGERILDAAECFRVLDHAKQMNCAPIIWNHWERLPAESGRLANLMMGRAIECCAPVVISDRDEIHELVELSNRNKFPTRRVIESSGEAIVDIGYAWGLDSAFKMVTKRLPADKRRDMRGIALDLYRSLC